MISAGWQAACGVGGGAWVSVAGAHGNHFGVVAQMSLPLSPLAGQVIRFMRVTTAPLPAAVAP